MAKAAAPKKTTMPKASPVAAKKATPTKKAAPVKKAPAAKTPKLFAFLNELGVRVNDDRLMAFVQTGIQEVALIRDVQAHFLDTPITKRLADARQLSGKAAGLRLPAFPALIPTVGSAGSFGGCGVGSWFVGLA